MNIPNSRIYDLAGIGIGPSNLSTAALLEPCSGEAKAIFFDAKPEFQWHPGMLFPEATIQVSFLKDLVTLADPSNPLSFLAFLSEQKRLYRFLTAKFDRVKRREFNQYFQWVCSKLTNLVFNCEIERVEYLGDHFVLHSNQGAVKAKNLSLACGLTPSIPPFAKDHLSASVFHAVHYLDARPDCRGKKVVVVGGGQSGAEIVQRLLCHEGWLPEKLHWVTMRSNFLPIDDSPFANEYFTPPYSDHFFEMEDTEKARKIREQTLASDGVEGRTLTNIYQRLYELEHVDGVGKMCHLHYETQAHRMEPNGESWKLYLNQHGEESVVDADVVIFSTGFQYRPPAFLNDLQDKISMTGRRFVVRKDFSIEWEGADRNAIFIHNGARHVRGVADPNLSLLAWRSGTIINSLMGRQIYDLENESTPFEFHALADSGSGSSDAEEQILLGEINETPSVTWNTRKSS
jgi:lysine N6-hydroxylase